MNLDDQGSSLTVELEDPRRVDLLQRIQEKLDSEVPLAVSLALWFADIENLEHLAGLDWGDLYLRLDGPSASAVTRSHTDILIGHCKDISSSPDVGPRFTYRILFLGSGRIQELKGQSQTSTKQRSRAVSENSNPSTIVDSAQSEVLLAAQEDQSSAITRDPEVVEAVCFIEIGLLDITNNTAFLESYTRKSDMSDHTCWPAISERLSHLSVSVRE